MILVTVCACAASVIAVALKSRLQVVCILIILNFALWISKVEINDKDNLAKNYRFFAILFSFFMCFYNRKTGFPSQPTTL